MKNLFCITLFLFCITVSAQSPTQNYVKVTTYLAPSTGEITENDTIVKVMYYDGLGRPKQIVNVRAGGGGEDIVTPFTYDQFGRQTRNYLPYASVTQNGNIHPDPIAEMEAFYGISKYGNTTNPYTEKILEASPLNRVMEQGAPGNPWAADPLSDTDHTIKFEYSANRAAEVRLYRVTTVADSYGVHLSTYVPTLAPSGFYNPGTLYKTITKDENWQPGDSLLHTTEEFKDLRGRVVLKRTYADLPGEPQAPHDTYYVYDKFSNLSYVIPPKVDTSDGVSDDELNELCYQYVYDHRNRIIEKKLPGKEWEDLVYNKGNHPVFTRDKHLENQGKWLFTKYDKFGRVVYTGLFSSTDSRETLQTTLENHSPIYETKADTPTIIDGTEVYYTNDAFPDTGLELLTISYYDSYNFDLDGATAEMSYNVVPTTETRSLSTGSKTRVLETDKWITSVVYYDKKARPIYNYTKNNYLNTIDKIKSKVDFVGKVLETTSVHTKDGLADITTIEKFTYDRMGRLLKHTHQLAGQQEETLAENTYDELGQLIQKKVGNTPETPLQTIDYSYNIRGWLTKINDVDNIGDDLFSFDIRYNDPTGSTTALYNGNISQTHWRTNNTDSNPKHYSYSYDALNRITGAIHNTGNYNLNAISYDKNGNILTLNRQGHINEAADLFDVMDNLVYSYDNGNKLLKVEDTANDTFGFKDDALAVTDDTDDYTYDDNGNMLSDTNKGITSISYNHLNLPTQITINGENIFYIYDASGAKQQKIADGTTTQYAGGYIYENGSLKFISHPEGYIEPDGVGGYDYVYQYKDHLGNIRLSYKDSNDDEIIDISEIAEESNYYPFGLKHQGYNGQALSEHKYKYNGKELNDEFDLNLYDYHARLYDPAIGRMIQIDPHAENWTPVSPYVYTINNPVNFVDPDGRDARISFNVDKNGNITISIQTTVHLYGKDSSKDFAKKLNKIVSKFGSKSYKQKDGTSVTVGFDISYKHHDSEESAKKAVDASPGDNLLQVDSSLDNDEMVSFPFSGKSTTGVPDNNAGVSIDGGKEGNVRGKISALYLNGYGGDKRDKLEFSTIHETFHFFGLEDRYEFNTSQEYQTDVLGQGNYIYSPTYGGNLKNPAITVHQNHYNTLGQFLISDNPSQSKNGGTRIYQTVSPNIQSELSKSQD